VESLPVHQPAQDVLDHVLVGVKLGDHTPDILFPGVAEQGERGQELAVVLVDLDRFTAINDHLGHHVGDRCLQEVADRLQAAKRTSDLVARIGGAITGNNAYFAPVALQDSFSKTKRSE